MSVDLTNLNAEELALIIKQAQTKKKEVEAEERLAKGPSKRGRGILTTTKKILLDDPNIDMKDLYRQVVDTCGPCSYSVMGTIRSDFLKTLELLKECGRLKEKEE